MTTAHNNQADPFDAHPVFHEIAGKMGLSHPIEALLCAPNRYEDYRTVHDDFTALQAFGVSSEPVVYRARVAANENGYASLRGYGRRGAPAPSGGYADPARLLLKYPFTRESFRLEIDLIDSKGARMEQTIFGGVWAWKDVQAGDELVLRGPVERFAGQWKFGNAAIIPAENVGKVCPVYLGLPGKSVNSSQVHTLINWVSENDERLALAYEAACERIRHDCGSLDDESILQICLPQGSPLQLESLHDLMSSLHFPASPEEGRAAIQVVHNICMLSMQCIAQRVNTRPESDLAPIGIGQDLVNHAASLVESVEQAKGFPLTSNQKEVIAAVCTRLQDKRPLKGLLSGEVGAGKTFAYGIPAVAAHLAGARVGILAPTDLLANQIANNIATEFGPSVAVERVKAGRKIRNPDAILVGTIGLNTAAKKAQWVPNLLIFDEQHKIHTAAREELVSEYTHTLEVSATPIPRSLGLSLYGGMDIFTLNEQPVHKDIQTGLLDARDRKVAAAAIRSALREGKRVAIVYTLVDKADGGSALPLAEPETKTTKKQDKELEEKSRKSAIEAAQLFESHFPGQVSLLHGKMTSDEKLEALERFRTGQTKLIVTTTIFETGIDVPEVQVLVVRDPEHLGLSQLHQLRGRLARSGGLGLCLLLTEDLDSLSEESYQRLNVFCDTLDGYELATQDMLSRGVGDLDGLQQNGTATTVFKSVKMTTQDLLSLDSERPELQVSAQFVDEIDSAQAHPQHMQQRLFT
jgi:ATP-dependent DNA helicase RecG